MVDIIRFYQRHERETIARSVTLAEAQAHCNDPGTSSSTCTSEEGKARTEAKGPWFDGYRDQERRSSRPEPLLTQLAQVMAAERSGRWR